MITDERLRWLSNPDYVRSEPGQIAAELLATRAALAEAQSRLAELSAMKPATMRQRVEELESAIREAKLAIACGGSTMVVIARVIAALDPALGLTAETPDEAARNHYAPDGFDRNRGAKP